MGGRKPGSSSRGTKRRPSFFKVLVGNFSSQLRVPPAFLKYFHQKYPEQSVLRSPTGRSWIVKMKMVDEENLYFHNGWETFVDEHSLELYDFLVFRYIGKYKFNVEIYDRTACEKDIAVSERNHDETAALHPVKKEQESDVIKEKLTETTHFIVKETEIKCLTVENCKRSMKYHMMLPRKVVEANGLVKKKSLQLCDPNGKLWTVRLNHLKDGRVTLLGWGELWRENNFEVGDTLQFKFIVQDCIGNLTLSAPDLRDPEISALIAAKLKEFHDLDMPGPRNVILWNRLRNWLGEAMRLSSPEEAKAFSLDTLEVEISTLEKILSVGSRSIGFCHNDLQYGNFMIDEETRLITIIDYEYASYNPVAYDLANHFCEMAANYHSETPHILDFDKYPSLEEQKIFVHIYLSSSGNEPSNVEVEMLVREIEKYSLASHLHWGLWGIISKHVNEIEFDYMEYARQRLQQYWLRKEAHTVLFS